MSKDKRQSLNRKNENSMKKLKKMTSCKHFNILDLKHYCKRGLAPLCCEACDRYESWEKKENNNGKQ